MIPCCTYGAVQILARRKPHRVPPGTQHAICVEDTTIRFAVFGKSSRTTQYAPVSSFAAALRLELFEQPARLASLSALLNRQDGSSATSPTATGSNNAIKSSRLMRSTFSPA